MAAKEQVCFQNKLKDPNSIVQLSIFEHWDLYAAHERDNGEPQTMNIKRSIR